jgi:hypothetical protein
MIAFVFAVIITVVSGISALAYIVFGLIIGGGLGALFSAAGSAGNPVFSGVLGSAGVLTVIISTLFWIVLWSVVPVLSLLVTLRLNRMRTAVSQGNIRLLRELNSMAWAIVALLLAGIVPGVLMLVAFSEINNLPDAGTAAATRPASGSDFSADDMDKLIRLKQLVDNGTITQQDFEAQKQRILHGSVNQPESTEPEELRKLKSLLDCGAISSEEYEIHKRRFLESL